MTEQIVEEAKKKAAYRAVDEYVVNNDMIIGIGSGSTIVYAVERLAYRVKNENLRIKACIPTSFQSIQLIKQHQLPLSDIESYPVLDLALDGADEVDEHLNCIKGGGGCQTQEKVVASSAKIFIVMADYRKESQILGEQWTTGVPLEVLPFAYSAVVHKLTLMGGKPILRMAGKAKAGPIITDNGNFVVDTIFGHIKDPAELENKLIHIPGIVETGLFIEMVHKAYFGEKDGSVNVRTRKGI